MINFRKSLDFKLSGLLRTRSVAKLGDLAGTGVGGIFVGFQDALGRCDSLNLNNFDAAGGIALVFRDHVPHRANVPAGRRPVGLFEIVSSGLGGSHERICAANQERSFSKSTEDSQ